MIYDVLNDKTEPCFVYPSSHTSRDMGIPFNMATVLEYPQHILPAVPNHYCFRYLTGIIYISSDLSTGILVLHITVITATPWSEAASRITHM